MYLKKYPLLKLLSTGGLMEQVTRLSNKLLIDRPPYMTRKHFVMLADELAHDKVYYKSPLSYHEKLNRMVAYCQASNANFNLASFKTRINKSYDKLIKSLEKSAGGTI